jgi:hypothetical protein
MGLILQCQHSDGKRALRVQLSEGDAGTLETLCAMKAMVLDAVRTPEVLTKTDIGRLTTGGWALDVLWLWARTNVRYTDDPEGVELLQHPERMLRQIREHGYVLGDCDDRTMLLASMFVAVGQRVAIVAVGRAGAGEFEHVLPALPRMKYEIRGEMKASDFIPFDSQEASRIGAWPCGDIERFAYEII